MRLRLQHCRGALSTLSKSTFSLWRPFATRLLHSPHHQVTRKKATAVVYQYFTAAIRQFGWIRLFAGSRPGLSAVCAFVIVMSFAIIWSGSNLQLQHLTHPWPARQVSSPPTHFASTGSDAYKAMALQRQACRLCDTHVIRCIH